MQTLCECGCGEATMISPNTERSKGFIKGQPRRFIRGHAARGRPMSDAAKAKIAEANAGLGRGRTLSPETRAKMSASRRGERNSMWRGDEAGYHAVHIWMVTNFPKTGTCEGCGATATGLPHDYANLSGAYRRDRSDWKELCRKCHKALDMPKVIARRAQSNP